MSRLARSAEVIVFARSRAMMGSCSGGMLLDQTPGEGVPA